MRLIKHGAYAIKKPDRINRWASKIRKALVQDVGIEEHLLSMQQVLIIDSIIDELVIVKMMGEYVGKHGVMYGAELMPCLRTSYLAYRNSISRSLVILGINKKQLDLGIKKIEQDQQEYLDRVDGRRKRRKDKDKVKEG